MCVNHYCDAAVLWWRWCAAVLRCCAGVVVTCCAQCYGAAVRVVTVCVVLCDDDIDLFVDVTPRVTTINTHTHNTLLGGGGGYEVLRVTYQYNTHTVGGGGRGMY